MEEPALSLVAEWVLPCIGVAMLAAMAIRGLPRGDSWVLRSGVAWSAWAVTRVVYVVLFWFVLDLCYGADMWAWDANTRGMAKGLVPGRDFFNLYGPLYPYLQAIGRWLTPTWDKVGTLWVFVIGDFIAVWAGGKIAGALLGPLAGKWVRLWLVVDPLLWHQLVVRAQDESLFVGTLLLPIWLIHRSRPWTGMVVLALGLCSTKITYAPYALGVLLALPGEGRSYRRAWVLWCAVVLGIYAAYLATGARWMSGDNYSTHSVNWGVGVSLSDAARRLFPSLSVEAGLALYGISCAIAIPWYCWRIRRRSLLERAVLGAAMAHAISLLTMPCSVSPYLAQGSAFLLLMALWLPVEARTRTAFLLLMVVATLLVVLYWTKSRWFSLPMKPTSIALHAWAIWILWKNAPRTSPVSLQGAPA